MKWGLFAGAKLANRQLGTQRSANTTFQPVANPWTMATIRSPGEDEGEMTEKPTKEFLEFQEWITRGPGESMLGGALKAAAASEKRRLVRRLETPNLFPHIEHEDRGAVEKADQAWQRGDKMVRRCKARTEAIKDIGEAKSGLRITEEDLSPYTPPSTK